MATDGCALDKLSKSNVRDCKGKAPVVEGEEWVERKEEEEEGEGDVLVAVGSDNQTRSGASTSVLVAGHPEQAEVNEEMATPTAVDAKLSAIPFFTKKIYGAEG